MTSLNLASEEKQTPIATVARLSETKAENLSGQERESSNEITFPEGGTRAWGVAIGNASVMFCTLGYMNSFGVYQTYYETHQLRDYNPSAIAWIGSLQSFFLFATGLFSGPLFDRYGAKIIRPAALVYVFSLFMTSLCKEYYQFMLAQGILGGISNGMVMSPSLAATPQYFNQKRGAAMGLAIAGSSIGGVIFPIALAKLFYHPKVGFGWSVRICAFMVLALLLPACLAIKERLPPRKSRFFLLSAFKELSYLALTAAMFCLFTGMLTPYFYLPSYAVAQGMDTSLAFYLVTILNGASFPGRVLPGVLADKFGKTNMLIAAGLSSGILTLCWQRIKSNAAILAFAAVFGFCSGAIISGTSVCLASSPKDPKNIGTYMGMGMAVGSVAALIGPPINGVLINRYKGFDQASTFSGVMLLAGCFLTLVAKRVSGQGILYKS